MAAGTRSACITRGSMSVVYAVDTFCASISSRRRTANFVGQLIMAVFANTIDKEAAASCAKEQAFVAMELNGTSARLVGNHNHYTHNGDKSYLHHFIF